MVDENKFQRLIRNLMGEFPDFPKESNESKGCGPGCGCKPKGDCESSYHGERLFVTGGVTNGLFNGNNNPSMEDIQKAVLKDKKVAYIQVVGGPAAGCILAVATPAPKEFDAIMSGTVVSAVIDMNSGKTDNFSTEESEFPVRYRLVRLQSKSDNLNLSFYVPANNAEDGDAHLFELISGYSRPPKGFIPRDFREVKS